MPSSATKIIIIEESSNVQSPGGVPIDVTTTRQATIELSSTATPAEAAALVSAYLTKIRVQSQ